jgi:formate dehydrogenase major subunit
MPWPCWGTPEMKHPGTPNLYDTSKPVAEGGLTFRARFGVEREGEPAGRRLLPVGSEIQDGYPEFTMAMLKLWLGRRPDRRRTGGDRRRGRPNTNWKTDLSGGIQRVAIEHGCAPFGNAKAVAWCGTSRTGAAAPRAALHAAARPGRGLCPPTTTQGTTVCRRSTSRSRRRTSRQGLPDHPHLRPAGRVRGRRRREPVQPLARRAPAGHVRRDQPGGRQQCSASRRRDGLGATVPRAQGEGHGHGDRACRPGVAFMPFHFGGHWQGEDLRHKYPDGCRSLRARRSQPTRRRPTATTSVTQMQETKATLCRIEPA